MRTILLALAAASTVFAQQSSQADLVTARARDLHGVAAKRRDRIGQHTLHAHAHALHLPSNEGRAVIFDGQLVARHVD